MTFRIDCFVGVVALLAHSLEVKAAVPRVAFLGDSITFDGRWATQVESGLRGTPEFAEAEIVNFGLGSETVSGLSEPNHAGGKFPRPCLDERLERILAEFKPTLVLACYGMNDGIYLPPDAGRLLAYQNGIEKLKAAVEGQGGKIIFITPPLHGADKPSDDPNRYDAVLDSYADWLVSRRADGWQVIDIRPDLKRRVAEAKQREPGFVYAADKVHPGADGHGMIAKSICDALWPLLKLPDSPKIAHGEALAILLRRNGILKLAWLSKTRHLRPGVAAGLPLAEAEAQAGKLLLEYRAGSGRNSSWNGYKRLDFQVDGRAALLVFPKVPAAGKPWIWRTEFFGHEPQADIGLLGKGFHVAYLDMRDLYGAPVALDAMDRFYSQLVMDDELAQKVVLEGFSRGGLYAFNWAARRPERVAGLYVDAPVCDFKSWPGGKKSGPGSKGDWEKLIKAYAFPSEAEALAWPSNPVDHLEPLAKGRVPILAVVGSADVTVPVSENIDVVEARYLALGGKIEIIRKPGGGHHPHSLPDPAPIVEFVLRCFP